MPKRGPGSPTEDHVNRRFGERLRFCRERAGRSQSDVGEALGVSFQQIQKYENGTTSISLNRIFDFADFIGITMSSLFDGLDARSMFLPPGFAEEKQAPYHFANDDTKNDDMKIGSGQHSKQKIELLRAFDRIASADKRRSLIDMAQHLAEPDVKSDI